MVVVLFGKNGALAFNAQNGTPIKLVADGIRAKHNLVGGVVMVEVDGETYDTVEGELMKESKNHSYTFVEAQSF
jgi:hypothetical protein